MFDYLDELHSKKEGEVTSKDRRVLDEIAEITSQPDANFTQMRELFESMPRTQLLHSRLKLRGELGNQTIVVPDLLSGSDMDQLNILVAKREEASDPPPGDPLGNVAFVGAADHSQISKRISRQDGADGIYIQGARQNNLKDIDLHIPRNKLVVITGVSGSGKSSLAFDTIYAEGQRRYVESLSSLARRFTRQMEKPDVDKVIGLNPAVAIEQRTISPNSRSTVGSITDVIDYLRVLFARVGKMHCPQCGRDVTMYTGQEIARRLAQLPGGSSFKLMAPVGRFSSKSTEQLLMGAQEDGYLQSRVDGVFVDLVQDRPVFEGEHDVEIVIGDFQVPASLKNGQSSAFFDQTYQAVEHALEIGVGVVSILIDDRELRINSDRILPILRDLPAQVGTTAAQPQHSLWDVQSV